VNSLLKVGNGTVDCLGQKRKAESGMRKADENNRLDRFSALRFSINQVVDQKIGILETQACSSDHLSAAVGRNQRVGVGKADWVQPPLPLSPTYPVEKTSYQFSHFSRYLTSLSMAASKKTGSY